MKIELLSANDGQLMKNYLYIKDFLLIGSMEGKI